MGIDRGQARLFIGDLDCRSLNKLYFKCIQYKANKAVHTQSAAHSGVSLTRGRVYSISDLIFRPHLR